MTSLNIRYKPDNNVITGMGGLMRGGELKGANYKMMRLLRGMIIANAIKADGNDIYLSPGRARELFSQVEFSNEMRTLRDGIHRNKRWAGRISVTGSYEGKDGDDLVKSSPVTIEFGSKYNEGTPRDRPRQDVMRKALARFIRTHVGVAYGWKDKLR